MKYCKDCKIEIEDEELYNSDVCFKCKKPLIDK